MRYQRFLAAATATLLVWSGGAAGIVQASAAESPQFVIAKNNYVQYTVKSDNGRFSVRTVEGDASRETDDNVPLLFEGKEPDTSFATFRIDGKDYIYGNSYGFLNMDGSFQETPHNTGGLSSSVWKVGNVSIRQTLEIVEDERHPNVGNVRIRYEATNTGTEAEQVGARVLLDTMLGSNDGAAFMIGGSDQPIRTETRLTGSDIPQYWRSVDQAVAPSVFSYGFMHGWGNTKPDSLVFGQWHKLAETKWDYTPDSGLDFTSKTNAYEAADSAVAMYWEPLTLAAGESRVFETYYGMGNFAQTSTDAPFALRAFAPDKLTVNETGDGYEEQEFDITVEVDNTKSGAAAMTRATASLILDEGLVAASGSGYYQTADVIAAGATHTFRWRVKATPQQMYAVKQFRVDVKSDAQLQPESAGGFVLLPGVVGKPPAVQFQQVGPETLYVEGTRYFSIKGQGYDVYKDKSRWKLILENAVTGLRSEIPPEGISVVSDSDMTVKVTEALPPGPYQVILEHRDFGSQRLAQTIAMSSDTKYMGRYYGLLAVKKVKQGDDTSYELLSLESEKQLEQVKAGLPAEESLLLEIRGEIMEKKTEAGDIEYIVNTDGNPATLNSVVEYKGEPLVIAKRAKDLGHNTDYVEIGGSGSLRVSGGMQFWQWEFGIELKDGEDYSLDAGDDEEPVTIEFTGLGKVMKNIGGFLIQINDAILQDKAVSFSGEMALSFLPGGKQKYEELKEEKWGDEGSGGTIRDETAGLTASVDNVLFGEKEDGDIGYLGIDTTTSLQLPEGLLGSVFENGLKASLTINTIDRIYGLDMEMKIKIIEFHGVLTIAVTEDEKWVLDDLIMSFGGEPGIPLVPSVFLTKLGGGVEDMAATMTGDVNAPPLKVVVEAAINVVKTLEGDFTLKVSKLGLSLEGELSIAKIPFLTDVSLIAQWSEPMFMELSANVDIKGIVLGEAYLYISGERFEGYVMAKVVLPKYVPLAGGKTLAGVQLGASSESIWGGIEVIGIPFGVRYYWGGDFELTDAEGGVMPNMGLYSEVLSDSQGRPVRMVLGDNIRRIGGYAQLPGDGRLASADNAILADVFGQQLAAGEAKTEHTQLLQDQQVAYFELSYTGEVPKVQVYRPDGTPYPLIAEGQPNANYMEQTVSAADSKSGQTEQRIYISVQQPDSGTWRIVTDRPVEMGAFEAKPLPKLHTATAAKVGARELKVDWTADNAADAKVSVSLAGNKEEAGVLLAEGIAGTAGTANVTVPADTKTGTYYVRVTMTDGTGVQVAYTEAIELVDPDAPAPVSGLQTGLYGDGMLDVSWQASPSGELTGYYIEVYDEQGVKVDSFGEQFVEPDELGAIVGGQQKMKDSDVVTGLIPGRTYKVSVMAERKTTDGKLHYSPRSYSAPVQLPVPDPAEVTLSYGSQFKDATDPDGKPIKLTNETAATLHFAADQDVRTKVLVNEQEREVKTGSSWDLTLPVDDGRYNITFVSVNAQGDTTTSSMSFSVDTAAPPLMVNPVTEAGGQGSMRVLGITDRDSKVTLDGAPVAVDQQGQFQAAVEMGAQLTKRIHIEAADAAGNISTYESVVVNTQLKPVAKVAIQPAVKELPVGSSESFVLSAWDADGGAITLDPSVVQWSLLKGDTLATLTSDGKLTANKPGDVVLRASYRTTSSFAFEDAIVIEVKGPPGGDEEEPGNDQGDPDDSGDDSNSDVRPVPPTNGQIDKKLNEILQSLIEKDGRMKMVESRPVTAGSDQAIKLGTAGSLYIPKGALQGEDVLAVAAAADAKPYFEGTAGEGLTVHNTIIKLQLADAEPILEQPARLELTYDASKVKQPEQLAVYRYNEKLKRWQYEGGTVDRATGVVSAEIGRLGTFALLENSGLKPLQDMAGRWSDPYVKTLQSLDMADGVEKNGQLVFEPQRPITRLEFTKLIASAMSAVKPMSAGGTPPFADWQQIPDWGKPFVEYAYASGLSTGTIGEGGTVFEPNSGITRAQAAAMLGRTLKSSGNSAGSFADQGSIPDWAGPYLGVLTAQKIVGGYPDGTFRPDGSLTREEAAKLIAEWVSTDQY
ncbi:S-layer homology domain-containing protein [Paenibacillus chartarius]|uniref:S-layer homology domain-containing protein n=1 Tax=Paenibacillus chartarius TaxID=747481 RepID=A0ABV6DM93_9BACL